MSLSNKKTLSLLVTLNEAYLVHLNTMLASALFKNPSCYFEVYLLHSGISEDALADTRALLGENGRLIPLLVDVRGLESAPTTDRVPLEMYYRILAAHYLPDTLERVLYLDPDIIVNGSLEALYATPLDGYYFAAASHNGTLMRLINGKRLRMEKGAPYINSGVLLMNLDRLRREQSLQEVFDFIEVNKKRLFLPDQDVISGLYGAKIRKLDTYRYNMTERLYRYHRLFGRKITLSWIRENAVILHYCGRNKPWKEKYSGKLDIFWRETRQRMARGSDLEEALS